MPKSFSQIQNNEVIFLVFILLYFFFIKNKNKNFVPIVNVILFPGGDEINIYWMGGGVLIYRGPMVTGGPIW